MYGLIYFVTVDGAVYHGLYAETTFVIKDFVIYL